MSGTSRDIYGEARRLADALRARGDVEPAQNIDDAIRGGSTASEILFDLRSVFDSLAVEAAGDDAEISQSIADLRNAVGKALA